MGSPNAYYLIALQYFAYSQYSLEDMKLAKELLEETSTDRLEKIILEKKKTTDSKHFYYDAGRTCQLVLMEAEEDCCDALNASIGGLNMFDTLIGLNDEGDKIDV